jgi:hypothetical protein
MFDGPIVNGALVEAAMDGVALAILGGSIGGIVGLFVHYFTSELSEQEGSEAENDVRARVFTVLGGLIGAGAEIALDTFLY